MELKALINLADVHLTQAKNYVVAYYFPIGLVVNFGANSLLFKKVFNAEYDKLSGSGLKVKLSESGLSGLKDVQD